MDFTEYAKQAAATKSPSDQNHYAELDGALVHQAITDFIRAGQRLDELKKAVFYGGDRIKKFQEPKGNAFQRFLARARRMLSWRYDTFPITENQAEILHAVLGIATESVEMVEAWENAQDKFALPDMVNLREECGDLLWYLSIIVPTQEDLEQICETNIAKLRQRYPNKFTELDSRDSQRDLSAERQILEGETPKHESHPGTDRPKTIYLDLSGDQPQEFFGGEGI